MDEDEILYQSIIADPEQVSPDVDVSGLRTETETSPQLLASVSEFPGLQFDPTQYSSYEDLYDLYSRGLPMVETPETDTIATPVVETPITDTSAGDQVTGDLTTDLITDPINTVAQQNLIDQGIGVQGAIGDPVVAPGEAPVTQQEIDEFNFPALTQDSTAEDISQDLANQQVMLDPTGGNIMDEVALTGGDTGILDTAVSGVSTAAKNAFEAVKDGTSTAAQFISDYGYPAYQALQGNFVAAGTALLNPLTLGLGFAGKIFESVGDTKSKQEYDSYSPEQQSEIDKAYAPGGIMQGYNAVSQFGQGVSGTVQDRIDTIEATIASGNRVATPEQLADPNFNSLEKQLAELKNLQDQAGLTKRPTQEEIFDIDDVDPADEGREIDFQTGAITGSPTGDVNIFDEVALTGQTPTEQIVDQGETSSDAGFTEDQGETSSDAGFTEDQGETSSDAGFSESRGRDTDVQQSGVSDPTDRGGGGGSSGGGGGCVIATHAVDSGAFTPETKREAVRWCIKNLHRTWWGEAVRRGYRYYGQKAIDEGKAKNHYQEFKDYVAFGTGRKRTLKTAWTFVYRTIQFFIKGITIKNAKR